jgi:hypothetical protein
MSQKTTKAIRRAAVKYAVREEKRIAKYQQDEIYRLTFPKRLAYALGVIFKWGK